MRWLASVLLVLVAVLPACAFHEGMPPGQTSPDKFGLPAANFYRLSQEQKILYLAGVADTLDFLGVKCPQGKAPSYQQAVALTEEYILRHHSYADSMWTAAAYLGVLNELGCKRRAH